MKSGRRPSASASATFCDPIAPIVVSRFWISAERSSRRPASVGDLLRALRRVRRRHRQIDVAVGDARLGGLADRGVYAGGKRRVLALDPDGDDRLAVRSDVEALDRSDRGSIQLDLVALDDL